VENQQGDSGKIQDSNKGDGNVSDTTYSEEIEVSLYLFYLILSDEISGACIRRRLLRLLITLLKIVS